MAEKLFIRIRETFKTSITWGLVFSLAVPTVSFARPDEDADLDQDSLVEQAPPIAHGPRIEEAEGGKQPTTAAPRFKFASNYCSPTAEGAAVRGELLDLKSKEEFDRLLAKVRTAFGQLSPLREGLLTEASAFSKLAPTLAETASLTEDIRTRSLELLEKLPTIFRAQGQLILTNYFKLVGLRMELEQMAEPKRWGLDVLRLRYTLELNQALVDRYLASGDYELPGVDIDPITRGGQLVYRLSINAETAFHSLVRAAARSQTLQQPKESYLETTRCILGRAILGKYSLNKTMLEQGNPGTVLNPAQPFCLGAKTEDFLKLTQRDSDVSRELVLRTTFLKNIPEVGTKLSRDSMQFMATSGLITEIALLAGYPDSIFKINANLKQQGRDPVDLARFKKAFSELDSLINAEFKKAPAWEDLRLVWRNPDIQDRLASLFDNCNVKPKGPKDIPLTINDFWMSLMRSDDAGFLFSLYANISSVPGRMLEMDRAQLTEVLRNYILTTKVQSSMRAIAFLVDYNVDGHSADADEIMMAADHDLREALTQEFKRIWSAKPELETWLNGLVDQIEKEKGDVRTFKRMVTDFTSELIKVADGVNKIMDPKRNASTLPYEEKHVLESLGTSIKKLSPENRRRYDLLIQETDYAKRADLWKKMSAIVEEDAKKNGATCTSTLGLADRLGSLIGKWVGYQPSLNKRAADSDCQILGLVASAIGAERPAKPEDISHTILAIQDKWGLAEVDAFVKAYRERLASAAMAEQPLLDLPIKENDETRLWQKIVRVHDAEKLRPDILAGLQKSVENLEGHLKTVVNAHSEKDLEFFIKRTKVINVILGSTQINQNDILSKLSLAESGTKVSSVLSNPDVGFVFPSLLQYHTKLQNKMVGEEDFKTEMWGEFMNTNATALALALFGGWVARGIGGAIPKFTGGPAFSSMLDEVGGRISNVIGAHADFAVTIFGIDAVRLLKAKYDANVELADIQDLRASEGAAIKVAGGAFPLITQTDFYKQKLFFEQARDKANSDFWETVGWMAFPFFLGHGAQMYSAARTRIRGWRELRYGHMGAVGKSFYMFTVRFSIGSKLSRLTNDLRRLGNPPIEYGQLRAARDSKWMQATSDYQRARIDDAYERIITTFGREIEDLDGMPEQLHAYAQALNGPGGSAGQLQPIYQEYIRLTRRGMQ